VAKRTRVRGVEYRSRVEAEWGIYLKLLGYEIAHEPFYVDGRLPSSGGAPSYLPDFWVPTDGFGSLSGVRGVVLEIKRGRVTDVDVQKWRHLLMRLEDPGLIGTERESSTPTSMTSTVPGSSRTTGVRFVAVEGAPPGLWHFAPLSSGECVGRRIADVWSYGPPPTELLRSDREAANAARAAVLADEDSSELDPAPAACELSLWISNQLRSGN
jgi:hypothetical protein